jgi:hypothetical protein
MKEKNKKTNLLFLKKNLIFLQEGFDFLKSVFLTFNIYILCNFMQ